MAMRPIRVLVVDDHSLVREGLARLLEMREEFQVVGEAGNGLEAVERARELKPDVVLLDVRMPELDGVEALRRIRAENPEIKAVVLTTFLSDDYVFRALEAGAAGYLLKDVSSEELFQAVRAAREGRVSVQPNVMRMLLDRMVQGPNGPAGTETLSAREQEVLRLLAQGATNKEIAASLCISLATVKSHVFSIFKKLDVRDRTEAVTLAVQKGIITLASS